MTISFVHLHVHSDASLLDGMIQIPELVSTAKEMGMPAVAVTDHGNMSNVIKLQKECKDTGVKPITGLEVYVAYGSRHNMDDKHGDYWHMVFLAKDAKGYENLCAMVTEGHHFGYRYKPRVDHEFIASHHEGLVCLTGCVAGQLPQLLLAGKMDKAREYTEHLHRWDLHRTFSSPVILSAMPRNRTSESVSVMKYIAMRSGCRDYAVLLVIIREVLSF